MALLCSDPNSQVLYWQRICYIVKYKESLLENIIKDDEYYNVKLAAYWLYYKSCEIGCVELDKINVDRIYESVSSNGIAVARNQLISNTGIHSTYNKKIYITKYKLDRLIQWFTDIETILQNVKIVCADWKRLFNDNTHWQDDSGRKPIGIFFDPPYSADRRSVYRLDSYSVAKEVNEFCLKNANKKTYRIVIAGYEGEHNNLESHGYTKYKWQAHGGYSNLGDNQNKYKERLWASKACNNIDIGSMTINEALKA